MSAPIYHLEQTLPSLAENLALDEALLEVAEAGGPEVLRLWEYPACAVVLGAGSRVTDDIHLDACTDDGVPVNRRSSGGGTVLLGPGCLLYSLILRFDRHPALSDLHASYRHILGIIQRMLEPYVSSIALEGHSDLAWAGRKFSGNAQQRKRTHLLHHGTILYALDCSNMERYLKMPPRRPAYREERGHGDFLTNVPIPAETLKRYFREAWSSEKDLRCTLVEQVARLVGARYGRSEWIRRR